MPNSLEEIAKYAREEMNKWGLQDWKFQFSSRKRFFGLCTHSTQTITVHPYHAENSPLKAVHNTVLHEIAHAKNGRAGKPHGREWKAWARRVGAIPERCATVASGAALPPKKLRVTRFKHEYHCPNCAKIVFRKRRISQSRPTACKVCCDNHNDGKFTYRFVFLYKRKIAVG